MHAVRVLEEREVNAKCGFDARSVTNCVDDLVRSLVTKAGRGGSENGECQEIILDTNVDGSRYLLVRVPQSKTPSHTLSPREQEIVRMVSQGFPNKIIAGVLNISSWTVSTHVRRIFAKLGVTSRAQMVAQILEVQTRRNGAGVNEIKPQTGLTVKETPG